MGFFDGVMRAFQGLMEVAPREEEGSHEEMKRCQDHLDVTYKNLCSIFSVTEAESANLVMFSNSAMSEPRETFDQSQMVDVNNSLTNFGKWFIVNICFIYF